MDLRNLLNQGDDNLSIGELKQLVAAKDTEATVKRITQCTFTFPASRDESFEFFDLFIQLLLSVAHQEDPYGFQYSKSIVINSLRSCISGLVQQFGLIWLIEFPKRFSAYTWLALNSNTDSSILIYLYGLVLASYNKPDVPQDAWIEGYSRFVQSDRSMILLHMWLQFCLMDDQTNEADLKYIYLDHLEHRLKQRVPAQKAISEAFSVMKEMNVDLLSSTIDEQLGNALARSRFTKDELTLGLMEMGNCLSSNYHKQKYSCLFKLYCNFKHSTVKSKKSSPLIDNTLLLPTPSDKFERIRAIHKGTLFWTHKMGEYDPYEFDMYLKEGILGTYPREQKTVLDTVLADWAARDPFKKHTEVIIQTVLSLLDKAKYNKRTAPYYAFVQLFNIPDEQQRFQELQHQQKQEEKAIAYSVKSGARIDLAHYSNGSDKVLVEGCRKILKIVTQSGKADAWVSDCLYVARPDIIQWYIEWLSTGLQKELKSKGKDTVPYSKYMSMTLQNAHIGSLSSYAVPVLLLSADLDVLRWLCFRNPKASNILVRYFSAGPQVTIHMLVQNLLTTKPKDYIDILLLFLRENVCDSWNKTAGSSHSWFKNHFLGTLLSITGGDASEKGVSSLLFQHMFTSANDFEWLFAMPTEKQEDFYASFPSLDIAKSHTIYNIKNNGLSAMLQEMVRLDDSGQRERLVNIWYKLWITSDQDHLSFAVPVNWIMQCIGLYDQAPALVKQMIEKLLVIGIQSKQDFTIHVLNLLLISDMPEPDSLFDIFLKVCNQQFDINNDAMINTIQRSITDILIELAEEIQVEFEFNLSKEALYEKTKIEAARIAAKNSKKKGKRIMKKGKSYVQTRRLWQQQQQQQQHQELEESLSNQLEDGSLTMKALITLVQRVINFLLAFLSSTSEPARIWHQKIQDGLIKTPLLYDALSKLAKSLSSQTEELQEDIQAVIDTCLEYLRKKKETSLVDIIQKILS